MLLSIYFVAVHNYGHYALLVGHIPVFLLASTCIVLPMHPTTKSQVFHQCPPYLPICGISFPLLVICSCATFKQNLQNTTTCFVKLLAHGSSFSCFAVRYPC